MKRQSTDSVELADRIKSFMLEAGWTQTRQARGLNFFSPPESLGIKGKYTIALPEDAERQSVSSLIHDAADSLVQIYGYGKIGDLLNRAASLSDMDRSTRIISRFLDDSTKSGAIPLASLAAYANSMEHTLYRGAMYKLGDDSVANEMAARQFAKDCLFLQTSVGSFIAKVEIPPTVLRQADLFGEPSLDSTEVSSSLFSALQFINETILGTDIPFDDETTLSNAISLFDVELLSAVSDVIVAPELNSIEFTFELGNRVRMTSTGWLSAEKKNRLKSFVTFIKEKLRGENNIDISGSIIELRSRDPEGDRNHIKIAADFYGDRTFFTATLNNAQYKIAVDAHKNKRTVRMAGRGTRLRTQVRIINVDFFE
ncbi:hypothetical protein [Delftia sp. GW456-R20]|uniref:hypothetical protein n=1 Tax=Delftia sp. GW456-R20 TaxID=1827145 RepID=UPI000AC0AC6E|nr:hypothetical protein [Delftia sp. GW456-R20]